MWRHFHISSINLSDVQIKQDGCYVGIHGELEENELAGGPIDSHQHQSPYVEVTDTNTRTNKQQDIVDIKPTAGSDYEGSGIGGSAQGSTSYTY